MHFVFQSMMWSSFYGMVFWEINSFFHYCQIVMHEGTHFWLRELTFDLARALGQDEAWYAEEFFTWNCPHFDIETGSFEEWLSFANSRFNGHIPEFDVDTIMQQGDVHIPDYEVIYHDSFKECRKLFKDIQQKLGDDTKLLGVSRIGNAYRCLRNGNVVLVTIDSLKPLLDFPFDKATCDLNGPEIVVFKDGLSAVFDPEGKQLTEFVSGTFKWHFSWSNDVLKREIYNSEAGPELFKMADRKEVVLGGCCIHMEGDPQWACCECEQQFWKK